MGINTFGRFFIVYLFDERNGEIYTYFVMMSFCLQRLMILLYQSYGFYFLLDVDFEKSAFVQSRLNLLQSYSSAHARSPMVSSGSALNYLSSMNDSMS